MGAWNGKWRLMGVAVVAGVGMTLAGCGDKTDKGASDKSEPAANAQAEPKATEESVAKTTPGETGAAPVEKAEPAANTEVAVEASEPATTTPESNSSTVQPASTMSKEEQRQKVMDALYAQIRLQMEQAIVDRKQLLDNGTPPSDEKVRSLEGKIMKARSLLQEAGEEVEEVDPPIVQPG